jgi:hypothetical protein
MKRFIRNSETTRLIPILLHPGDINPKFSLESVLDELNVIFKLTVPNVLTYFFTSLLPIWTNYSLGQLVMVLL